MEYSQNLNLKRQKLVQIYKMLMEKFIFSVELKMIKDSTEAHRQVENKLKNKEQKKEYDKNKIKLKKN